MDSFTRQLLERYDEWEQYMLARSESEGLTQEQVATLRWQIVTCHGIRFADTPAELSAVAETINDAATLLRWVRLCATAPAHDIALALAAALSAASSP